MDGHRHKKFISNDFNAYCRTGFDSDRMLALPSKPSRNENDMDPINEKTIPIYVTMGIISTVKSDDSDSFLLLFFAAVRSPLSNPALKYLVNIMVMNFQKIFLIVRIS